MMNWRRIGDSTHVLITGFCFGNVDDFVSLITYLFFEHDFEQERQVGIIAWRDVWRDVKMYGVYDLKLVLIHAIRRSLLQVIVHVITLMEN